MRLWEQRALAVSRMAKLGAALCNCFFCVHSAVSTAGTIVAELADVFLFVGSMQPRLMKPISD